MPLRPPSQATRYVPASVSVAPLATSRTTARTPSAFCSIVSRRVPYLISTPGSSPAVRASNGTKENLDRNAGPSGVRGVYTPEDRLVIP